MFVYNHYQYPNPQISMGKVTTYSKATGSAPKDKIIKSGNGIYSIFPIYNKKSSYFD